MDFESIASTIPPSGLDGLTAHRCGPSFGGFFKALGASPDFYSSLRPLPARADPFEGVSPAAVLASPAIFHGTRSHRDGKCTSFSQIIKTFSTFAQSHPIPRHLIPSEFLSVPSACRFGHFLHAGQAVVTFGVQNQAFFARRTSRGDLRRAESGIFCTPDMPW